MKAEKYQGAADVFVHEAGASGRRHVPSPVRTSASGLSGSTPDSHGEGPRQGPLSAQNNDLTLGAFLMGEECFLRIKHLRVCK